MGDKFDYLKEQRERHAARVAHIVKLAEDVITKTIASVSDIEFGDVLGRLHIGTCHDKRPASLLQSNSLTWMHDKLVEYSIPQVVKEINAIYAKMVEHGFVNGNKFDWNDLDNKITVMRTEYPKVMTFSNQNRRWIVIFTKGWEGKDDINVYSMYEKPVEGNSMLTEPNEGESHVEFAQRSAETFMQYYTDNVEGAWSVYRPDYSWFEDRGFDLDKIEDRNSNLPLFKYSAFDHELYGEVKAGQLLGRSKNTYHNIHDISRFFFETETALLAIEEDRDLNKNK